MRGDERFKLILRVASKNYVGCSFVICVCYNNRQLSIILCKVLKHNGVCVINVNKLFGDDMLQMPESYYSVQTSMLLCLTGP